MAITIRILHRGEDVVLKRLAVGVFDREPDPILTAQFLEDPRHHLAVAIEEGVVVGMVSGVDYVHPDKPAQMWINEIGVAASHRGRGLGKALLAEMLEEARRLGCVEGWVLTERSNAPAMKLYASQGGKEADQVMFSFQL